jgi:hypothetical protein
MKKPVGFVIGLLLSSAQISLADLRQSVLLQRSAAEHLVISDAAQGGLDLTSSFTIEAWVKPSVPIPAGQEYVIVSKWSANVADKSYVFLYYHDGQKPTLRLGTAATSTSDDEGDGVPYSLAPNVWTHVAVVFKASTGTAEFFANGRSVGSINGLGNTVNDGTGSFQVGARNGPGINGFDGWIDEVRVWNIARTSGQIAADYGTIVLGAQTGLVGSWRFACDYLDESGNGNTLAPANQPEFSPDSPFGCGPSCSVCM